MKPENSLLSFCPDTALAHGSGQPFWSVSCRVDQSREKGVRPSRIWSSSGVPTHKPLPYSPPYLDCLSLPDFRGREPELPGKASTGYMNAYYFKLITSGVPVVSDNPLILSNPWFPFRDSEDFESCSLCGSFSFFIDRVIPSVQPAERL